MDQNDNSQSDSRGVLNEALKRIEQAKLYEALLNHDLFSEDSARPEIIEAVREEMNTFILSRLEVLMGMRTEESTVTVSPFSDQEVAALKALAARALSGPAKTTPTAPVINPVAAAGKTASRGRGKRSQATEQVAVAPVAPPPREKSGNVSTHTGEDYSQAINTARPPLKMPSQMEIDMMHAKQAAQNAKGAAIGDGMNTPLGANVSTILQQAQRNPNIKEE